ncbi:Type VI secretion protein VasK [Bordetella sputigena]|uniref:type VI secretion system membrane subunit TssM n=1 Tax=Bordetella sputigena TaxID=1416810 RepID=UPI0039EEFFEC
MLKNLFGGLTFRRVALAVLVLLGIAFVVQQSPRFSYAGYAPFASPMARAWLTVALCLLWIFAYGVVALVRRLDRLRITWQPAPPEPAQASYDDGPLVAARERLDGLFRSTLRVLRKDGPMWRLRRHSLYRLPWYLTLGSAGGGKTMLLAASRLGLGAPVPEAEWKPGDPCRFWLGDRALLIEADGIPVAGDPAAGAAAVDETAAGVQAAIWQRLLKRVRQARRQCPVNGVIIAVSVPDLLDGEHVAMARAHDIRARLRDMQRCFRRPFPVYFVITQCDRLAGFDTFFTHLDRAGAEQPWGVTFAGTTPRGDDAPLAAFRSEFVALVRRLQDRVVHLAATAGDDVQAGAIYGFPSQFESLNESLHGMLGHVFGRSFQGAAFWLRGVYFTSAARDGQERPISASPLAAAVRGAAPSRPRGAAQPHGYFIAGLLRDVVFREAGLADRAAARARRRVSRYLTPAALTFAVVAIVLVLLAGYDRNRAMMRAVHADTVRLSTLAASVGAGATADDLPRMLALLDAASRPALSLPRSLAEAALVRRVGLYQGDRLVDAARAEYRALLRQALLPFIQARAREAMTDAAQGDMPRFRALRTYLMLGDAEHFDASTVLAWVARDARVLPLTDAGRTTLLSHARALLDVPDFEASAPLDRALVSRVRAELSARPLADRLYDMLQSDLAEAVPEPLSVAQLEGMDTPLVLHRPSGLPLSEGVPGMYTLSGYHLYPAARDKLIAGSERDRWVLRRPGSAANAERLRELLDRTYFSRYIEAWDALLNDVRVGAMPPDARDGAAEMHVLAGADSPLRRFLQAVAVQTDLAGKGSPPTPVDRHFGALHQLFQGQNGAAPPIARIQSGIEGVAQFLDGVDAARQHGIPAPPADAIASLQDAAEGQPPPLRDMLQQLANDGRAVAVDDIRRRIDELWRADVAPFCHAAVDNRYPIDPRSSQDMTQDDFNRLFGPAGLLATFFQANLLTYIDMSVTPWRWRPNAVRLGFSRAALQVFQDAATIRQAFFPDGGKTMVIRFQLLPLFLDSYFTRFNLTLGNQSLSYAHGPAVPVSFAWPDGGATQSGRISYEPADPGGRDGRAVSGPWALFRLLDMGTLQTVRSDRYKLDFNLSGKQVSLELDAGSVINPFGLPALRRFKCLDRLLGSGPAARPMSRRPQPGWAGDDVY